MATVVGRWTQYFGPYWHVSISIRWIAIKFFSDIWKVQWMNSNDFGYPLTLASQLWKHIYWFFSTGKDIQYSHQQVEKVCFLTSNFQLPGDLQPASTLLRAFTRGDELVSISHFNFIHQLFLVYDVHSAQVKVMKIDIGWHAQNSAWCCAASLAASWDTPTGNN